MAHLRSKEQTSCKPLSCVCENLTACENGYGHMALLSRRLGEIK